MCIVTTHGIRCVLLTVQFKQVLPVACEQLHNQGELVQALKDDTTPSIDNHVELSQLLLKGLEAAVAAHPQQRVVFSAYPCSDATRVPPLQHLAASLLDAHPELAERVSIQPLLSRTHSVAQRSSCDAVERSDLEFEEVRSLRAATATSTAGSVIVLGDDVITRGTSMAAGDTRFGIHIQTYSSCAPPLLCSYRSSPGTALTCAVTCAHITMQRY
jgi:hypothetical protein